MKSRAYSANGLRKEKTYGVYERLAAIIEFMSLGLRLLRKITLWAACPLSLFALNAESVPSFDLKNNHDKIIEARPELKGQPLANLVRLKPEILDRVLREGLSDATPIQSEMRRNQVFMTAAKKWVGGHTEFLLSEQSRIRSELSEKHGRLVDPWNYEAGLEVLRADRRLLSEYDFFPGYKNPKVTTSYYFGRAGPRSRNGAEDYSFKIFLTFKKLFESLSPVQGHAFAQYLAEKGCGGNFKFIMIPGYPQTSLNNIVLYANNFEMAKKVERAAHEFWAGALRSSTRGVDGTFQFDIDNGHTTGRIWPDLVSVMPGLHVFPEDVQKWLSE